MDAPPVQPTRDRRFEALVSSIRDYAIFMLDASGRVETWNLGARAIKGYAPEEIIGQSIERFYTPEAREAGLPGRLLARARDEGRVEDLGWRVRKDGTQFFADVVITAVRDGDGTLTGYAKVTRDLTQKRADDERRIAAEQRFRNLVEAVSDYAIFMLDPDGRVATWNTGASQIKGYTPDEIIGQHFSVFYPPEQRAAGHPERELELAMRVGRFEEEGWRLRKDGTAFWANVVLTPVQAHDGRHLGFVKVTRDLTERRSAELERERLVQAQEAVRLRDEFLSIASHELRTPLMALQLQLESLQKLYRGCDSRLEGRLDRADRSARRLADLVDALLDVTRIATGKLSIHPTTGDLGAIVSEVLDRMQDSAERARCTLTATLATGGVGHWDALRIGQVITNLLSNAFRYAAGTAVEVSLHIDAQHAHLRVSDHGPGIPEQEERRIFERFERAADHRHFGGLGLGLYVAQEIVVAHGGTIRAHNADDGGAVFEITLPLNGSPDGA